jgi:hypothetical protein
MGLLNNKYYSAFKAINKVRNNYAHKHDYKVTLEELNAFKFDWVEVQKKAFAVACEKKYWRGCKYCHNVFMLESNTSPRQTRRLKRGASPFFHLRPLLD